MLSRAGVIERLNEAANDFDNPWVQDVQRTFVLETFEEILKETDCGLGCAARSERQADLFAESAR